MMETDMRQYDTTSLVEKVFSDRYHTFHGDKERIKTFEVPDFPLLGKFAALRFIEWLQRNPEGVAALPTGKTPEHFIGWFLRYLRRWEEKEISEDLASWGIDPLLKPDMRSYRFVQIDEFYPMNPEHENSFSHYIKRFYLEGFGFDRARALLMDTWTVGVPKGMTLLEVFGDDPVDISLCHRSPKNDKERLRFSAITVANQAAMEYEERIISFGGIGFFLGGIGPDGHIGFNIRGSDHFSTTRITPVNYETAAAAATDLGGMEISRQKIVMTIGLSTITRNISTTALIIAAGESKAEVVRNAIEEAPSTLYPATSLQSLPASRFYITRGAARLLSQRSSFRFDSMKESETVERILTDIACVSNKRLMDLSDNDLSLCDSGRYFLSRFGPVSSHTEKLTTTFKHRIGRGVENSGGRIFLHTGPHHDDIMLGYFPAVVHLVRNPQNTHYFATFTSGFTSVTNSYTATRLTKTLQFLDTSICAELAEQNYFAAGDPVLKNRDVYLYLDGIAAGSQETCEEAESRRMLRNLLELFDLSFTPSIKKEVLSLLEYFARSYPGRKDSPEVQKLKGMIREWEEELLWAHLGFDCNHIFHLRLGFYTGDIFTPPPEWDRDVLPVLSLLEQLNPDIVTVALDPEGSGPDTHYKVLQATAEALRAYSNAHPEKKNLKIWGYRNVWYRFHPAEANIYIPVSMNSLAILRAAFLTCFGSQRSASFPSHEYDGPFSDLTQKIMVEQYATLKTCLGRDFFYANPIPWLRACRGLNFIKEMDLEEFFDEARALKRHTETEGAISDS
jgi:glucosamine-6-phosphate deaminase